MKKNKVVMFSLLLVVLLASCATSKNKPLKVNRVKKANYTIIDDKGSSFGLSEPDWIAAYVNGRTELAELYSNKYAFVVTESGQDLDGVKLWAETFSISSEVGKIFSTTVKSVATKVETGDKDNLKKAAEAVTTIISDTEFSGLMKESDWWILKQYDDGKEVYELTVLYLMDREVFDRQIDIIISSSSDEAIQEDLNNIMDQAKKETFGN